MIRLRIEMKLRIERKPHGLSCFCVITRVEFITIYGENTTKANSKKSMVRETETNKIF